MILDVWSDLRSCRAAGRSVGRYLCPVYLMYQAFKGPFPFVGRNGKTLMWLGSNGCEGCKITTGDRLQE